MLPGELEAQRQWVLTLDVRGCSACVTFSLGAGRSTWSHAVPFWRLSAWYAMLCNHHLPQNPVPSGTAFPRATCWMAISAVSCAAVLTQMLYLWAFVSVIWAWHPFTLLLFPKWRKLRLTASCQQSFQRTTGQITRKIAQSCLVKSKNLWGKNGVKGKWKKNVGHFSLCLLS